MAHRPSIFASGSTRLDQAAEDLLKSLKGINFRDDDSDEEYGIHLPVARRNSAGRPQTAPSWLNSRASAPSKLRSRDDVGDFGLPGMIKDEQALSAQNSRKSDGGFAYSASPRTPVRGGDEAATTKETTYAEAFNGETPHADLGWKSDSGSLTRKSDSGFSMTPQDGNQQAVETAETVCPEDYMAAQKQDLEQRSREELKELKEVKEQVAGYKKALDTSQEEAESLRRELAAVKKELRTVKASAETAQNASEEVKEMKDQLHKKNWDLIRLEGEQEKTIDGYTKFLTRLSESSARSSLDEFVEMSTLTPLGRGNYGFVMTAIAKDSCDKLVLKLMSPRWVHLAVEEWTHGSEISEHDHIVEYREVVMHRDEDKEIESCLIRAFEEGGLTGKRPKYFPTTYVCCILEYMDRGTVQNLMDRRLIDLEGVAAITRQVASALAFMHSCKRTHNDIKPENILLRQAPDGSHLIVKLADLGLAVHSADRKRDYELFGYTVWCMGLNRSFDKVPAPAERKAAVAEFQGKSFSPADEKTQTALTEVLDGIWSESWEMRQAATDKRIQKQELRVSEDDSSINQLEANAVSSIKRRTVVNMEAVQDLRQNRRASLMALESGAPLLEDGRPAALQDAAMREILDE